MQRLTTGFQEASAKQITLHDDDPDALETVLRYLYGLNPVDLAANETVAVVIRSVQVIITADKYGIDPQLNYDQHKEPHRLSEKTERSPNDLGRTQNVYC
jgi:hypothetical protein